MYDFATSANVSKSMTAEAVRVMSLKLLGSIFSQEFLDHSPSDQDVQKFWAARVSITGDVSHVFSHIRKTYRVVWTLVTGGDGPPERCGDIRSNESTSKLAKSQDRPAGPRKENRERLNLPTETVWVPLEQVADAK